MAKYSVLQIKKAVLAKPPPLLIWLPAWLV